MRGVYRVLAGLIALGVVVQASAMVFAISGLIIWVENDDGMLDKAALESDEALFDEAVGFMIHGMNGMMVMPLLALLLLVVSFFAKVPGGVKWAALILVVTALQITLGILGYENSVFGLLHGINALLLFGLALMAFMRSRDVGGATAPGATAAGEPTRV